MEKTSRRAARALWYMEPMRAELHEEALPPLGQGQARIRMLASAISRGTERLIASGLVPKSEYSRMRCPMQAGDFPFPVKYGYCAVGEVESGPAEWLERRVFVLHPHQDFFDAPIGMLNALPEDLPLGRAALAANMETALNAIWDSGLSAADRVVVVGGGLVGLLVTYLAAGFPGARVTLVDIDSARASIAADFGADFALPAAAPRDADVVFHCSASQAGLETAFAAAGQEARIVELSWYGERPIVAPLGGHFHAARLDFKSSQVGTISPGHAARGWTYSSRLQAALRLLRDERLDALITEHIAFEALPRAIPTLLANAAPGLVTLVTY